MINGAGLFSTDALILNLLDNQALTQKAKQIMLLEKSYQASSDKKEAQVR